MSFATVYWIDVFVRALYMEILVHCLAYCRGHKGMEIYGYCIMPCHIHLVFRSTNNDPSGLIRDFKGYTSKKMMEAMENNQQESRKEWLLWMYEKAGKK